MRATMEAAEVFRGRLFEIINSRADPAPRSTPERLPITPIMTVRDPAKRPTMDNHVSTADGLGINYRLTGGHGTCRSDDRGVLHDIFNNGLLSTKFRVPTGHL